MSDSGEKHTAAPWTFETRGDGYHVKGAIGGFPVRIATVHGMRADDARLIAAAPDLLALARQYAAECGECDGMGRTTNPMLGQSEVDCPDCVEIRQVIAKAVGP